MKIKFLFFLLILLLMLLSGCGQSADVQQPPEIVYGQDVCDRCGMIINEENFAAAYWTEDGEARRFDDIGGMLAYISEEGEKVATYWVHDFHSGQWITGEEAHYVLDSNLMTPMGFGIAAFSDEDQAKAFAYGEDDVRILAFSDLMNMNITMPGDLHDMTHAQAGHGHK